MFVEGFLTVIKETAKGDAKMLFVDLASADVYNVGCFFLVSDNSSQFTNAEFSLLFLMISNHRNVCVNNSLPDYV